MRYCPNCLRHTVPDVIKAFCYAGITVGPFIICSWCGWWLQDRTSNTEEATA
jgi:hypothetical protein